MRKFTKSDKAQNWHIQYKTFVIEHFDFTCQHCKKKFSEYDAHRKTAVHHKTYKSNNPKGIYEDSAIDLIHQDKITLLCHQCHLNIHSRVSIDLQTKILPKCSSCGNGMRIDDHQENLGLCRECWSNKDLEEYLCKSCGEYEVYINGICLYCYENKNRYLQEEYGVSVDDLII